MFNRFCLVLVMIVVMVMFASCDNDYKEEVDGKVIPYSPTQISRNVYYFDCVGGKFRHALADFTKQHNTISICGNGIGPYGCDIGFWVVT